VPEGYRDAVPEPARAALACRAPKNDTEGITMSWYLQALSKYALFGGRARRKEYWFFVLFNLLASIAVSVRRLHDTSRSGWWLLIVLIPVIGAIVLLVFMVLDGTPRENQYGPNPKELGEPA
jgi:uncharacterized membrane protein YhaH (DUF805 family)